MRKHISYAAGICRFSHAVGQMAVRFCGCAILSTACGVQISVCIPYLRYIKEDEE